MCKSESVAKVLFLLRLMIRSKEKDALNHDVRKGKWKRWKGKWGQSKPYILTYEKKKMIMIIEKGKKEKEGKVDFMYWSLKNKKMIIIITLFH